MEDEKIRSNSRSYGSTQAKGATDRVVYIEHSVLANETIAGISVKYDVPIHNIRRANRLLMTDTIYQDMKIYVPTKLNPAMLTVSEINGEPLVIGDGHAPVKIDQNRRSSYVPKPEELLNVLESPEKSTNNTEHHCDSEGMRRQQSVHELFDKVDQTVTAVKGSLQNRKDGFSVSQQSSSSEELFATSRSAIFTDDNLSNRSATDSRTASPRIRKVDSQGRRIIPGLSSNTISLQLANDDNTDFPL